MTDNSILHHSPIHPSNQDAHCTMSTNSMTYDYHDSYHLNAPVPQLETEDVPPAFLHDAAPFVTQSELSEDESSSADEEEVSLQHNDSDGSHVHVPAEVSYEEYESEIQEEDDDDASASTEAELSDDEGFDESDYESECTMDYPDNLTEADDDESSCTSIQSMRCDHELFLPADATPTYETLKYESVDESDDEEEISAYHRTYFSSNPGYRPRRMMMLPKRLYERRPSPSNISDDSSEDSSIHSQDCPSPASPRGVSFSNTVTVHPIFETEAYDPSMLENMYTNRDELRLNKLRNKREFAYDDNDWENATEECDMETDEDGELVHPVHTQKRKYVRGPFLSTVTSSIWQPMQVQRTKRPRMYYS